MPRAAKRSEQLFERARKSIPGGVNSPVRAFRSVGGTPPFMVRGQGSHIWDEDGNEYVDYICSWGPLILGHRAPEIVEALQQALATGTSFGMPTAREIDLAEAICDAVPSIEMVRLVNSGTEATMSALRLARAYTGRDLIVKFEGCYHGHVDSLLVKAGSGVATLGIPDTVGVPKPFADTTIALPFNATDALDECFEWYGDQIAAVIVEPVVGNMGCVPPQPGFLEGLRKVTRESGALLIFDEVMTGFRAAPGGAQALYGVKPDLTTLGTVIGGGLPVGAYGGKREYMEQIAPAGPVYQAGTLSGNPLSMAAGIATLTELARPGVWEAIGARAAQLEAGVCAAAQAAGVALAFQRVGTMFTPFFSARPVGNWSDAKQADTRQYARFFRAMLAQGVYLPPSQFEAGFLSAAHGEEEIEKTVRGVKKAMEEKDKG